MKKGFVIAVVIIFLISGVWLTRKNIYELIVTDHSQQKMVNFIVSDLNGNELMASEFSGKVLVMDFWSISCGACLGSFPEFQKVATRHKDDSRVAFIAVNIDRTDDVLEKTRKLIAEHKYTFPIAYDKDAELTNALQIKYLPTLIIVDREGWIRVRHIGYNKALEDFEAFLNSQLKALL